uniref:Uncharacterized protein n=1 Tax=Macrostomum lignano TaxID=282301 RepID=A0A1I8F6Z8_9PLAT
MIYHIHDQREEIETRHSGVGRHGGVLPRKRQRKWRGGGGAGGLGYSSILSKKASYQKHKKQDSKGSSAKGSSGGGISDVGLPSPSDSSIGNSRPKLAPLCWNLLDDFINWYRKGRVVIGGDTVAKQKQLRPIQEDPEASAAARHRRRAVGQQSERCVDLDGFEDESSDVVGPQLVRSQGSFKHQHPYQPSGIEQQSAAQADSVASSLLLQ